MTTVDNGKTMLHLFSNHFMHSSVNALLFHPTTLMDFFFLSAIQISLSLFDSEIYDVIYIYIYIYIYILCLISFDLLDGAIGICSGVCVVTD